MAQAKREVNGNITMLPQDYNPAVPVADLTPHPANPNHGDLGLLSQLFQSNGFAGALLVQKSTGIIIDGEHRWLTAQNEGMATLPCLFVDCTDDERDRFLAEWNESTRQGRNDEAKLLALLKGLADTPRGLDGTAHTGDDIDSLLAKLNMPLQVDDAPTGARYSETDDEQADRQDRAENYQDRKGGGTLIEMILAFAPAARDECVAQMDTVRSLLGDKDMPAAEVALLAVRVLVAVLEDEPEHAAEIARG